MNRMPFSTWSARGILGLDRGRVKTQTRRFIKPQPPDDWEPAEIIRAGKYGGMNLAHHSGEWSENGDPENDIFRPHYKPGEIVAMGEALVPTSCRKVSYAVGGHLIENSAGPAHVVVWPWKVKKLPSIYMPLWAARRWLRIVGVRAERMLDISEEDAQAEGLAGNYAWSGAGWHYDWQASDGAWYADHTSAFAATIRGHNPKMGPEDNPWLWAYTLEQVEKGADGH